MYKEFFGLKDLPFSIAPNPQYLFMTPKHREALAHLLYGVQNSGGFVLLTGEVGTGKTTISRCFLKQISTAVDVAYIINPKLTAAELLQTISDELGIPTDDDVNSVKHYLDKLNHYLLKAHSEGRKTVLLIDEAQNLSADVLEQLRLLTNLETDREKLLQIVLIGQPELQDMFQRQDLRQLSQRVTARFHLDKLSLEETAAYVKHRLRVAGTTRPIFSRGALQNLHRLSDGIPRLINIICDRALLGAYSGGAAVVEKPLLARAAGEATGRAQGYERINFPPYTRTVAASVLAAVLGVTLMATILSDGRPFVAEPQADELALLRSLDTKENNAGPGLTPAELPFLPPPAAIDPNYQSQADGVNADAWHQGNVVRDTSDVIQQGQQRDAVAASNSATERLLAASRMRKINEFWVKNTAWQTVWSRDLDAVKTYQQSYTELFRLWGLGYDARTPNEQPCTFAERHSLSCLAGAGDLQELTEFNRPVVVKLSAEEYDSRYLLLVGISEDSVRYRMGGQVNEVPRAIFESYWTGDYTLLWRTPDNYYGHVMEGSVSPVVKWLKRSLAAVNGKSADPNVTGIFDAALDLELKRFQERFNLIADGVAGEKTFITLNDRIYPDIPRLSFATTASNRFGTDAANRLNWPSGGQF